MGAVTTNLGPAADSFVGREADLARLHGLLSGGARLVTLIGPPGVGKTRLARHFGLEAASGKESRWREIDFVDLGGARDAASALADISAVLGLGAFPGGGGSGLARIAASLVDRGPTLLLLDQVDAASSVLAPLLSDCLAAAPDCQLLATSRQRLQVPGEHLHEVRPFPPPEADAGPLETFDAVRLFVDRARAVGADVHADGADAAALAEVMRRLDGLPLSLEMAAARLTLLDLPTLARLLRDRAVLAGSGTDGSGLQAAIRFSWELLDRADREALGQCAAFRGSFDLAAAEVVLAVAPPAPPSWELLQRLRDRSLLQTESGPAGRRLKLLRSIREFARDELLRSSGYAAAALRHAHHFAGLARLCLDGLDGPDAPRALAQLAAERGNLAAVFDRAARVAARRSADSLSPETVGQWVTSALWAGLALDALWFWRGYAGLGDHLDGVRQAIEGAGAPELGVDPLLRARAELGLARTSRLLRQLHQTEPAIRRAELLLSGAAGSDSVCERDRLSGRALAERAALHHARGELCEGDSQARRAVEHLTACGAAHEAAMARTFHAAILRGLGDAEAARHELEQALAQLRALGARQDEVYVLWSLTAWAANVGDAEAATSWARQALVAGADSADGRVLSYVRGSLGLALGECLELDEAEAALDQAIEGLRRSGEAHAAAHFLIYRAELALRRDQHERAAAVFAQALRLGSPTQATFAQNAAEYRAELAWRTGDPNGASLHLRDALAAAASGDVVHRYDYLHRLAALACLAAASDEADRCLDDAAPLADRVASARIQVSAALYAAQREALALRQQAPSDAVRQRLTTALAGALARPDRGGEAAWIDRSWAVQCAARRLLAALPASVRPDIEADARDPHARALVVSSAFDWIRLPGGQVVERTQRPQLARLAGALAQSQLDEGGRHLTSHELIDRVWPEERIVPEAAANRLYYLVSALRKAGLGKAIQASPEGYRLDPGLRVLRLLPS